MADPFDTDDGQGRATSMADMTPTADPVPNTTTQDSAAKPAGAQPEPNAAQGLPKEASAIEGQDPGQPTEAAGDDPEPETDTAAASEEGDDQPPVIPDHMSPEDAYEFGKYHQSRADRIEKELKSIREQSQQVEQYAPLLNQIMNDPEALQFLAQRMPGGDGQPGRTEPELSIPDLPEPPQGILDEDTERFLTDYHERSSAAMKAMAQHMQAMEEKLGKYEQQSQQIQERTQREQAVQEAQYQYGLSRQEANEFVDMHYSGDLYKPELLISAYRNSKRPSADEVRRKHAEKTAQQQQQRRTPASASASGGGAAADGGLLAGGLFQRVGQRQPDPFDTD